MLEGDTVWRAARRLHDALAGRTLTRSDIRVPQWATLDLTGIAVDDAVSRGKHPFIRAGDVSLHTHLKMEGVPIRFGNAILSGARSARPELSLPWP